MSEDVGPGLALPGAVSLVSGPPAKQELTANRDNPRDWAATVPPAPVKAVLRAAGHGPVLGTFLIDPPEMLTEVLGMWRVNWASRMLLTSLEGEP